MVFQTCGDEYCPQMIRHWPLEEVINSAARVFHGTPQFPYALLAMLQYLKIKQHPPQVQIFGVRLMTDKAWRSGRFVFEGTLMDKFLQGLYSESLCSFEYVKLLLLFC